MLTYREFCGLLESHPAPVVLLEGTRELLPLQAAGLEAVAEHLARTFPHACFRTGNARGSDAAFAAGVCRVNPRRLEFVLPYAGHRRRERPEDSPTLALEEISTSRVQELVETTLAASPQYERTLAGYRGSKTHPRQSAAARLLLRDTLKITGSTAQRPVVAGVFQVNAADPERGGTGHTMRVCRAHGIPVISQFHWLEWCG